MTNNKIQNKFKIQMTNSKIIVLLFGICALLLFCALDFVICHYSFAQEPDLDFTLDVSSSTVPLPKIFRPNIDLSGRGFYEDSSWPQTVASKETLAVWQKDIGFSGFYRIQYNLWEINQLAKDKNAQKKLLDNYDEIIKNITLSGGTVVLNIFGTPAGLGNVLDKRSAPVNSKVFKGLIKDVIRDLSCVKKYNIWYEVWSTPDLDGFFLGAKQEYLNLYREVAKAVIELETETGVSIPLGGPGSSWWFQNFDGNTIVTAEKSLIYELARFCYQECLPLDFVSWHGYSSSPETEKENTVYEKSTAGLIREWLSYFHFDKNTPLIVSEWNFDSGANILSARKDESYICASFIPARLKNMNEAGIDNQLYFCLEDFQNEKENITRNLGVFFYELIAGKSSAKAVYNVFRLLSGLGSEMFAVKFDDQFVGVIATKEKDSYSALFYNYIDPDMAVNYLSKNIASLNSAERKALLDIINSDKLKKLLSGQADINILRLSNKVKALLGKTRQLNETAKRFSATARNIKFGIKNLNGDYLYQRYTVDSSCSFNCGFLAAEEKEISAGEFYQEVLTLKPYSVHMVVLKKKPVTRMIADEKARTGLDSQSPPKCLKTN